MILNHTEDIVFGQQHPYNLKYLRGVYGRHYWHIPVELFPHFQYLTEEKNKSYNNYLKQSWKRPGFTDRNTAKGRKEKEKKFDKLLEDVTANPEILLDTGETCITGVRSRAGQIFLTHGNHRVSIAKLLNLPFYIKVTENTTQDLKEFAAEMLRKKPNFFGGRDMPYQSVFLNGIEVLEGRRPDIADRFSKIQAEDIVGKNVLELGCNIGANLFLSLERGARRAVGVEKDMDTLLTAIRINQKVDQNIDFLFHDLNNRLSLSEEFDTVFCFSVAGYIEDQKQLARLINRTKCKVLYFEGHINKTKDHYPEIFSQFSKVEALGFNLDKRGVTKRSRPFFRLIK